MMPLRGKVILRPPYVHQESNDYRLDFRTMLSGVPNDTLTGNLICDFPSTDSVLPRQLPLISNFPGKKISALHC